MIPVVYVNCSEYPYVHAIMAKLKPLETRNRDTLRNLVGKRVLVAQTGKGTPTVMCMVTIGKPIKATCRQTWDGLRPMHRVPVGSAHDWKETTKQKYLYQLTDPVPVIPFPVPEGKRHGRVWIECDESALKGKIYLPEQKTY